MCATSPSIGAWGLQRPRGVIYVHEFSPCGILTRSRSCGRQTAPATLRIQNKGTLPAVPTPPSTSLTPRSSAVQEICLVPHPRCFCFCFCCLFSSYSPCLPVPFSLNSLFTHARTRPATPLVFVLGAHERASSRGGDACPVSKHGFSTVECRIKITMAGHYFRMLCIPTRQYRRRQPKRSPSRHQYVYSLRFCSFLFRYAKPPSTYSGTWHTPCHVACLGSPVIVQACNCTRQLSLKGSAFHSHDTFHNVFSESFLFLLSCTLRLRRPSP